VPFDWHGNEAGGTKGIDLLLQTGSVFFIRMLSFAAERAIATKPNVADGFPISWSDGNPTSI